MMVGSGGLVISCLLRKRILAGSTPAGVDRFSGYTKIVGMHVSYDYVACYDCWEGNRPIPVHHPDNLNRHRRVGRDQTTGIIGHQGSDVSRVTRDTRMRPVNRLDWEADRPE
ncbi:hypothetical protein TNCV_2623231 [Trichonephila clavipes]|nr:hypothetical protein TNCV_2623231 [Trichonephila clavipes]